MPRKKKATEDDRIEELEKQVRELKSINRGLLKKLKKADREYRNAHQTDFIGTDEEQSGVRKEVSKRRLEGLSPRRSDTDSDGSRIDFNYRCGECGKGELEEVIIVNRVFERCSVCGYRSKAVRKL